jgi:hypothetical protein
MSTAITHLAPCPRGRKQPALKADDLSVMFTTLRASQYKTRFTQDLADEVTQKTIKNKLTQEATVQLPPSVLVSLNATVKAFMANPERLGAHVSRVGKSRLSQEYTRFTQDLTTYGPVNAEVTNGT